MAMSGSPMCQGDRIRQSRAQQGSDTIDTSSGLPDIMLHVVSDLMSNISLLLKGLSSTAIVMGKQIKCLCPCAVEYISSEI